MLRLFVYGTLKKGHYNHHLLESAKFIGNATLEGFHMYSNGGFPYITNGGGSLDGVVHGEVFEVEDESTVRRIRMLESAYDETPVQVTLETGETLDAFAYTFPTVDEYRSWRRVESGVFESVLTQ